MGNSQLDWTKAPIVQRCRVCGDWTLTGSMVSGRQITVSLTPFTPQSFAHWASGGRKPVYVVINGGVCLVRAGDGTRLDEWRPEHVCPVESLPQGRSEPFTPPCERGVPGMCGRTPQERSAGVRNCDMCDAPPSEPNVRPLDAAAALLIRNLGAVMIERETNDRIVYRNADYR